MNTARRQQKSSRPAFHRELSFPIVAVALLAMVAATNRWSVAASMQPPPAATAAIRPVARGAATVPTPTVLSVEPVPTGTTKAMPAPAAKAVPHVTAGNPFEVVIVAKCPVGATTGTLSAKVDPALPDSFDPVMITTNARSMLEVPTQSTTAPGKYDVTVKFTADPSQPCISAMDLPLKFRVDAQGPVQVDASPAFVDAGPGTTATFNLTYDTSGAGGPVTLEQVNGLPANAKVPEIGANQPPQVQVRLDSATHAEVYDLTFQFTYQAGGQKLTVTTDTVHLVVGTITLFVDENPHTVMPGQSLTYKVTVMRDKGFKGPVQVLFMSPPPPSADCPVPPLGMVALEPDNGLVDATKWTTNLVYTPLDTQLPGGPYCLALRAFAPQNAGIATEPPGVYVMFQVVAPNPTVAVALSASPASRTVQPGQQASYGISIGGQTGTQAPTVTLAVAGLPAGASASFSPQPATSSSTLTVAVPAGTATGTYRLTVSGSATGLKVQPVMISLVVAGGSSGTPVISGFSPTGGPSGTNVAISGSGLASTTAVTFSSNLAATFSVQSDSQVLATVPVGAVTGPISVTAAGGTATSIASFTVTSPPPPTITSLSPASGVPGTQVAIRGSNLGGVTVVAFNGTPAPYTVVSSGEVDASVPSAATTGPVTIATPSGTASSPSPFTVVTSPMAPTITSFSPGSGPVGTVVTIQGTNLSPIQNVFFNGSVAVFNSLSSTTVQSWVPPGATSGPIRIVTATGAVTSASSFTVQ